MPGFCSGTEIHPFLSISGIFEDGYRFLMLLMLFSNLFDVDLRDDFFGSNTWDTQRDLHPSTDHCCCCFRWSCYTLNVQGYIQNFGEVMFKIPQLKETCHLIKVVFFFFEGSLGSFAEKLPQNTWGGGSQHPYPNLDFFNRRAQRSLIKYLVRAIVWKGEQKIAACSDVYLYMYYIYILISFNINLQDMLSRIDTIICLKRA